MQHNNLTPVLALLAWLSVLPAPATQWTRGKVRPSAEKSSAAFSPDGRSFALLDGKGAVHTWDVATGKAGKEITLALGPDESAEQVRYTPAGDLAVLLCRYTGFKSGPGWFRQGTISACLWNISSGKRSPFVEVGYGGLAICPKGVLLAYGDGLWEIATGKKLRTVAIPKGLVFEIGFSPDGKTVVYQISESLAQDFAVLFLADAATGKKVIQIGDIDTEKHRGECGFLSDPKFSPDGNRLAFSEIDRPALHLWDVTADKAIRRIALKDSERLLGFSPDGKAFVSWHRAGGRVRLWEAVTGKERRAIHVKVGADAVLLSLDGKVIAVTKGKAVEFHRLTE